MIVSGKAVEEKLQFLDSLTLQKKKIVLCVKM